MAIPQWMVALTLSALLTAPALAQEKPTVAMIGTGTLGGTWGPKLAELGYPLVYGSREPDRESVRALVTRSGANASAALPADAAARADVIILAVPKEALEEVARGLGDLAGKVVLDVSGGEKRVAEDGYLELTSDSANAQRLQARHPGARVVRILLPLMFFLVEPELAGPPPSILIAGNDARAKEVVARLIFDHGLNPVDAGPLRFAHTFDAFSAMAMVPLQQGRPQEYALSMLPGPPLTCFIDAAAYFGFGRPYDIDDLAQFPRRHEPTPCDEWLQRLARYLPR